MDYYTPLGMNIHEMKILLDRLNMDTEFKILCESGPPDIINKAIDDCDMSFGEKIITRKWADTIREDYQRKL